MRVDAADARPFSDDEALADLRQSREDFTTGDAFSADEVCTELERCRSEAP